jgi:hypothetical protein
VSAPAKRSAASFPASKVALKHPRSHCGTDLNQLVVSRTSDSGSLAGVLPLFSAIFVSFQGPSPRRVGARPGALFVSTELEAARNPPPPSPPEAAAGSR